MSETMIMAPALPEIFMAILAMAMLMLGVFSKGNPTRLVGTIVVICFFGVAGWYLIAGGGTNVAFNGLFTDDAFARFAKILVLIAAGLTLIQAMSWMRKEDEERFEYPVLITLAVLGMMMMISSGNLMSLYMGLELQSLSLYVLAAYRRDNARSTEAGLKYFVLGALASGLTLYGASLVYGFAGTVSFQGIATVISSGETSTGLLIGLVFVISGLAFKVSAVPFHMWTPDVYEGAPTPVTAFFAVAPKIAALALILRVMMEPFGAMVDQWQQVIAFIAVLSMGLGAFAAIGQTNLKRLLAYSSIGHVGYALVGVAAGTAEGVRGVLVYLAIYLFMNVGTFAVLLAMRRQGRAVEGIDDLSGLSKSSPAMALAMTFLMFSMAGVPPLAGFFGKYFVFMAAVDQGMITLAVLGVLASVVSAFYYLRIIKIMFFDDVVEPLDPMSGASSKLILLGSTLFVLLFFLAPTLLLDGASAAAQALTLGLPGGSAH
ncbi:MAG: NADH-quinone oxidoreductase subunit NuoN [Rhodospirillaceae bacterium]